jgi:peptidyl-prolyl cis-trans isomerase A (cyclophilin A)
MRIMTTDLALMRRSMIAFMACAASAMTFAQEPPAAEQPAPAPVAEATPVPPPPAPALVNVIIHTTMGDIAVALEEDRAPLTTKNFLHYVDTRRYDGATFYRAVDVGDDHKYGMLQGGIRADPKKVFAPIPHESPQTTGLSHVDGAISMARFAPGSAKAEFFIVMGNLLSLDGKPGTDDPGYAVFGHVTSGLELAHQIMGLPRDPTAGKESGMVGQMIAAPVKILTVRRADAP